MIMKEKLLRIDRERGKAIVLQTTVDENGIETSREVEMELPPMKMVEGTIKKIGSLCGESQSFLLCRKLHYLETS